MSRIAVIGQGYVGITSAVGMSHLGHQTIGLDINTARVVTLNSGSCPIQEHGLDLLLNSELRSGRLKFTDSYEDIGKDIEFAFICVSTPASSSGSADLSNLDDALDILRERLSPGAVIVIKSTVPVGTCMRIATDFEKLGIEIASNPEFLSEGNALHDFLNPSRIIVGAKSAEIATSVIALYQGIESPKLLCDLTSAETIKHASNSFLAVKLSFVNELSNLSERTGSNIESVIQGIGMDPRIGNLFLNPGPGWGGSCFPKDTSELTYTAKALGVEMRTVEAAIMSNQNNMENIIDKVTTLLSGDLVGKKIAVWGLSFKAKTDDTRDSPALKITKALIDRGSSVSAYDPMADLREPIKLARASSPLEACRDADLLLVLTEWDEFRQIDPIKVREGMKQSAKVYDLRRVLDPAAWKPHFQVFKVIGQ